MGHVLKHFLHILWLHRLGYKLSTNLNAVKVGTAPQTQRGVMPMPILPMGWAAAPLIRPIPRSFIK